MRVHDVRDNGLTKYDSKTKQRDIGTGFNCKAELLKYAPKEVLPACEALLDLGIMPKTAGVDFDIVEGVDLCLSISLDTDDLSETNGQIARGLCKRAGREDYFDVRFVNGTTTLCIQLNLSNNNLQGKGNTAEAFAALFSEFTPQFLTPHVRKVKASRRELIKFGDLYFPEKKNTNSAPITGAGIGAQITRRAHY